MATQLLGSVALTGALAAAGVAVPQHAVAATPATVYIAAGEQGGPRFVGGAGQVNQLQVTKIYVLDFEYRYVFDDQVRINPGAGCARPSSNDITVVECRWVEQATTEDFVVVRLGDRDDEVSFDVRNAVIHLYGGPGADRLYGHGVDRVSGESGDDAILGGGLQYGGDGHDVLVGDGYNNRLEGGRGNDLLRGEGGDDVILGNSGRDVIRGGTGADQLDGGADADEIYGNSGNDRLVGGAGHDYLSGGPGNDVVRQ